MPYVAFDEYFRDIAARETRSLINLDNESIPPGEFGFMELFCDECDCRRAVIRAVKLNADCELIATLSYGWGTRSFYSRWMGYEDDLAIRSMMGIQLMDFAPQSSHAESFLTLFKETLKDEAYEKRIRRHYSVFRKRIKRMEG